MNAARFSFRKLVNLTLVVIVLLTVLSSSCAPASAARLHPFVRDIAHRINRTFGIVLADRTAHWTANEAYTIWQALDRLAYRIKAVFGENGEPVIKALFEGDVFYRDSDSAGRIAYTIAGTVSFYDLWAGYDDAKRTFYLYHEMGHLLDTRGSLMNLFMGEISGVFSGKVGSYVDNDGHYQLGQAFPKPAAGQTVRHRTDSAAEDWAETFASVLMPEFENDLRNVGITRRDEVGQQFARWLNDNCHEQRAMAAEHVN